MRKRVSRELKEYKELPYAIFGHSSLLTKFDIAITGNAIKEIAKQLKPDEDVIITVGENDKGFNWHKIEAVSMQDVKE